MHLLEHFSEGVALLQREFRVCYATSVDAVHLEHLHVQDRHQAPIGQHYTSTTLHCTFTALHCTAPHCTHDASDA